MQEKWDFYQCRVNDKPASIYLDLGLRGAAPNPCQPVLMIVWVHLLHPHPEHGMSTNEEFSTLSQIEDRLLESVARLAGTAYAGRITNDGRREFYFYGPSDASFEPCVQAAMSAFEGYRFDAWSQPDPEWSQYLGLLYPSPSNLRWMTDRQVVSALEENGDVATQVRAISHFSYFRTASDRSQFLTAVGQRGFRLVEPFDASDPDREFPFGLIYENDQTVELNAIFETTESLVRSSEFHSGTYDGWECQVMSRPVKRWWQIWK